MLITFSQETKDQIATLINDLESETLHSLGCIAVNCFLGVQSNAEFSSYVKKNTPISSDNSKILLRVLNEVFYEAAKSSVNEIDFLDSLTIVGVSDTCNKVLYSVQKESTLKLRGHLRCGVTLTSYYDLKWRLEMQIARKSLLHEVLPKITLCLTLADITRSSLRGSSDKQLAERSKSQVERTNYKYHALNVTPNKLIKITQCLEMALAEVMSPHCRRIMRSIK